MLALEEEGQSALPNTQPFSPEAEHLSPAEGLSSQRWQHRTTVELRSPLPAAQESSRN